MISLVSNKFSTPGLLLAIAVAFAFLIGALVNREARADAQLPAVESAITNYSE